MSPKLPRITATEARRALHRDGWLDVRQAATSHLVLQHPTKPGRVVLPIHTGKILPPWLLSCMLKDAGLTPDEFRSLL